MPDFKVTLSRSVVVNGSQRVLQLEADIPDTTRNLAIPLGIDELMTREATAGYKLVPKEAVDYWKECRANGNLLLYEIQTKLTTDWGIDFGIQEAGAKVAPVEQPHRNGTAEPEVSDLDSMLTKHLKALQGRNTVLSAELERKQAEFDRNNADIMRISQMLTAKLPEYGWKVGDPHGSPPTTVTGVTLDSGAPALAKKRRGRPPKEQPHVA